MPPKKLDNERQSRWEYVMDQMRSSNPVVARFASPLINCVKRVVTGIGILTDSKGYRDEIARYKSEIQLTTRYENEPALKNDAGKREPATS